MNKETLEENVIIIFGFSGSGKSTLAEAISQEYELRVVHPSGILRDLMEGKTTDVNNTNYNKGFWESQKGIALFKSRLEDEEPMDVVSDKILLQEVEKGNVVIDSWSLPWLTDKGRKIYLEASLETRAKRVSQRSQIDYEQALDVVHMKDEETRNMFKRVYGFDIQEDTQVFDYILKTDNLSKRGVFEDVCGYLNKGA